jgi:sugar phosphate isomerase/epimerase
MRKLYIIPNASHIEKSLELAERYGAGFEYNDFYLPDVLDNSARVDELINFYKSLPGDRSENTLHGAFFDIAVHSSDREIRAISDKRVRQSMDIARRLGVRAVVFHTNLIANFKNRAYVDSWINMNAAYWRALSADYPDVSIYIENMFDQDPEPMVALMRELEDVPGVSACLDFAHASAFGDDAEEWVRALLPYASHLHLNDNDGIADLHLAMGAGKLDYTPLFRAIAESNAHPSVLIEMSDISAQTRSIEYMQKNHIYPFEKGK